MINLHNDGGGDSDEDQTPVIILKSVSIVVMLAMTLLFGCLPFFWYNCLI
jgi:hypothetical protein